MNTKQKLNRESILIRRFLVYSTAALTLFLASLLGWNIIQINQETFNRAYIYTRVGYEKDVLYRRWVAEHGGVYVTVDSATQSNPYLAYLPNRDIYIDSVLRFTLMNPAYMTREVFSLQEKTTAIRGHITSLSLINPNNAPDEWEKQGLLAFEKGAKEFVSVDTLEGKEYFRFMKPFYTEENCLQCHAQQGYMVNDIRGAISVSYPMEELTVLSKTDLRNQYLLFAILWLGGLGFIFIFYISLKRSDNKRKLAEKSLLDLNDHLEEEIKIRTTELRKSQNDWENIFNTIGTPAQVIDANHIIRYVNEDTLRVFNLKREDLINKKCHTLFHLCETPPANCPLVRAKADKKLSAEVMPFEYNDKAFIVSCSPIRDIDGKVQQFIHIMTDITDRKEAERQLRESEDRWHFALEGSQEGVWDWNLETNTVFFSKRWKEMLGFADHEITNNFNEWDSRVHPDDREKSYANLEKHFGGEHDFMELEHRLQCKDGQYKWILSRGKILLRSTDNRPLRIIGTHKDITEQKKMEQELRKGEKLLRLLIEHSPASIAMFDNNMIYIIASERYLQDYYIQEEHLPGRSHYDVFPDIPERWKEIHRRCLAGETIKDDDDVFPRMDGSVDYVRWEIRPWFEDKDQIGGLILFSEVITQRKQAETELKRYRENLELLIKERTQELEDKNTELFRINKLFVGRELRMKELKDEIDKLKGKK